MCGSLEHPDGSGGARRAVVKDQGDAISGSAHVHLEPSPIAEIDVVQHHVNTEPLSHPRTTRPAGRLLSALSPKRTRYGKGIGTSHVSPRVVGDDAPQSVLFSLGRGCRASEDRSSCLLEEPKVVTVVPDLNDLSAFDPEDVHA